jgi:hypothetical protein
VWLEQWKDGVAFDGPHIAYHAMTMYAWAAHYGYAGPSLWTSHVGAKIDAVMIADCSWDFNGTRRTIESALGDTAATIFDAGFLAAYRSGSFGAAYATFDAAFAANRIGPYAQTAPLAIWQGDADTTVPKSSTDAVVEALRAGGDVVDYRVVPGGEHITTAFGFVAQNQLRTDESTAWVKARLEE